MTKWLLFSAMWWVTGNPVLAIVVMLLAAWAADRAFIGVLPDPLRRVRAWMYRRELQRCLENNPVDGTCLLALGRDAVERWRHHAAREYLVRALERMPEEREARYLLGLAEIGCKDVDAGLARIRTLVEEAPRFRFGEPWLEVGARLLSIGRPAEATEALQGFVKIQPGSVRGRFLLGVALDRGGDRAAARASRRQAWQEYRTLPAFRRKAERRYAWRSNPTRPLLYGAVAMLLVATLGAGLWVAAPRLLDRASPPGSRQDIEAPPP